MTIVYKWIRSHLVDEDSSNTTLCGEKIEMGQAVKIISHTELWKVNCPQCRQAMEARLVSER